ncbi:2-oxoglutarate ferredoxin oxidoreductase subunit alpha [Paucidesulfovibrio gracilis DSM 16080]|uniref:2-oxoglutarate ferredoxin oxidoreductase subunit alpha n=1 Tax=Paucidesulfovibrio gracilis DSM 16080 TaxID=1121449 RepID=A0A1T4WJF2_9BACT|nr:2-oxoacid:acceptor oxidoreductase subunit alpha [Paucidesulfovibrio gracilis]SKA77025.1 2-oxoglutarate ferredoxin oxidoreductase subunit alpha [Paucidesulfovibrio gracilis DSM 16080]
MPETAVNILVGGEAGQGLATIGELMAKALTRAGYEMAVTQDYQSRIRGGHNTFAIRAGVEPIWGPEEGIDILVALNQETVDRHGPLLKPGGVVVAGQRVELGGYSGLQVPFRELAPKPIYHNVAALGVLGATLCGDPAILEKLVSDTFSGKGDEVVRTNLEVLRKAYEWVAAQDYGFTCMPSPPEPQQERLMLHGNQALALGALAAGCNFVSFYPMTPSTSIALTLIGKGRDLGLVSEQAEDEIAALNMALGASYAGARACVTTSGGGFALMVEAVSLAGITETPVVIFLVQRPGPATGLPTRTEQADLNVALHAGHGEFPRALLTPGTVEECFHFAHLAFDLAERHQSPVIVLSDQFLADQYRSVAPFDLAALPEGDRPLLEVDDPATYQRYALTEDGVSPRVIPGFSTALVKVDSDEHDQEGHIDETPENRMAQNEKRLRKGAGLRSDVIPPELLGPEDADVLLVCWGSGLGACVEAMQQRNAQGQSTAVLHFKQVWPMREDQFMPFLERAKTVVGVEGNATGQFAGLVRRETGFVFRGMVLRADGYPLTARYVLEGLESLV